MVARSPTALTAASWDRLARDHLAVGTRGVLHSVFDRALNLRLDTGELIGLVGPGAGNGPATVVLAAPPVRDFPSIGLVPGASWAVVRGYLSFGAASVTVDLSAARLWSASRRVRKPEESSCRCRGLPGALRGTDDRRHAGHDGRKIAEAFIMPVVSGDEMLARLRRAKQAATQAAPDGGLGALLARIEPLAATTHPGATPVDLFARPDVPATTGVLSRAPAPATSPPDFVAERALAAAADFVHGWRSGDPEAVSLAAMRLSGLGPGLTPSGDDLLAGFLIGVAAAGGHTEPALNDAVALATRGRTTDIAAARVRHAARGRIEERIEDVLAALLTGDGTDLESAVERAATWGHTSGVDTLVGLFLGLRLGLTLPSPYPTKSDVGDPTSSVPESGSG